ncbi:MAG: hypothetical protein ACFUZC_07625 [Chthoniobacteraceae bacterium]
MFNFPARAYNDVMAMIRRSRPLPGINSRIKETQAGVLISPTLRPMNWDHPWTIHPRWVEDDSGTENWSVTFTPGFVNGADAVLGSDDVPLTASNAPVLKVTNFRDATGVGGAYPAIFKKLGVREPEVADQTPDSLDGTLQVNMELFPQQYGTRRLAAADFLLHVDHTGTRTDTTYADPDTGNLVIHSTAFTSAMDRYPYRLSTVAEFTEPQYPTMLERLLGTADEPNYDELKLATLWLLSPPDEPDDSSPGPTWIPYTQHYAFWNLGYANVNKLNTTNLNSITIHTGLAFGLLDSIGNSILSTINDANLDVVNALNETSMQGHFWTI